MILEASFEPLLNIAYYRTLKLVLLTLRYYVSRIEYGIGCLIAQSKMLMTYMNK